MTKIYMLHGFMGTGSLHFQNQISYLEDKEYELVLLDLPGHGSSEEQAVENYFEHAVNWVITKIKQQGQGYIVGLSLGANIAMHVALREPNLLKGLILTGYSPFIPQELKGVMENQYHYFVNIEENDKNVANHFKELHGDKWLDTLKKVLYSQTFHYPTVSEKEIGNVTVPTMVLNGSNQPHEVDSVTYIKRMNKTIEVGLIPNAGHTANKDQVDVFNIIMNTFLHTHK